MKALPVRKIISIAIFILLGFISSVLINNININSVVAQQANRSNIEITQEQSHAFRLEKKGQELYHQGNYQAAIQRWEIAQESYQTQGNILLQARALSNLGLAYYQIGNWQKASFNIETAYNLVAKEKGVEVKGVLAQIFNNQGIVQLASGSGEKAFLSWQKAQELYDQVGDDQGYIRAAINQANGLEKIGFYHRAFSVLSELATKLEIQPDSRLKTIGLRNYGDILRLSGNYDQAESILSQSLAISQRLNLPQERVQILLALGKVALVQANFSNQISKTKALEYYQEALMLCQATTNCLATDLPLQINLAQFNLLLTTKYWWRADLLIPEIKVDFKNIARNRNRIYHEITFAHSALKLYRKAVAQQKKLENLTSLSDIHLLVTEAITSAQNLHASRLESYGFGLQGQIQEELQDWQIARDLTTKALQIAQLIDAPEISYIWEWQLARINKGLGNRQQAIAHYDQATKLLEFLSTDLVSIDPNLQSSFRDTVEPIYRQTLDLLLTHDPGQTLTKFELKKVLQTIESLQLAELNNFFREDCLDANHVEIDSIDTHAAAIYPIILPDRLEVIVSLPQQLFLHYTTKIKQEEIEATINQLRQNIVIRSRRQFYQPATELYDYLIRPVIGYLEENQIETLVFVPDGVLRNIPLGTLYDGEHFLIEDYNIVLNPGLQLLNPRPLQDIPLDALALGISQARAGFPPLYFVDSELEEINNLVDGRVLVNDKFTTKRFRQEIKISDYPIVHIATHGQFSSSLENTFLLTWDNRITINQLNMIFHARTLAEEKAIELLVLSACETADGDKRAALGLAGMAVRAGAKSTIASLWSVNDQATTKLMSQLYQELVIEHQEKAQAIRNAQLALLKDPNYQHPYYWSSFVLVGNWL